MCVEMNELSMLLMHLRMGQDVWLNKNVASSCILAPYVEHSKPLQL